MVWLEGLRVWFQDGLGDGTGRHCMSMQSSNALIKFIKRIFWGFFAFHFTF